ncbi:peroxisome biogenesis protein 1 [Quercus suber]|uniref:Peroxisome biogenesis protein 1 n=1 Tax=Quercus suber TaxID=58331 RepID=A0AAW0IS54_QUESU
MELEVRLVGGIENCFVSLPLPLVQTLDSSSAHLLTLELRSRTGHRWFVAWSGATSTSSSSAIEVSQQFADCISLPDRTAVQVRAISNVAKATLVTIEPHSEDDWEVLELNSEHAEAAILNQRFFKVRIVYEAMKFPLWLHGRTVTTVRVVSTFPKKGVVQLVAGTEVAVAPKRRKKNGNAHEGPYMQSSIKEHPFARALLRIQDPDRRFIHKSYVNGVELGVVLTSVAFIHPETAQSFSLDSLQFVVIIPRSSSEESSKNSDNDSFRKRSSSPPANNGNLTEKKKIRQAVVHLLISESVAKGHVMFAKSLRLYLGVGLHSCMLLLPDIQLSSLLYLHS